MTAKRAVLTLVLLIFFFVFGSVWNPFIANVAEASDSKQVDLLFTHDIHSHLDSYRVTEDGEVKTIGGAARLKSYIDAKKKENPDTLVVDGGDFAMGTLYQTLYSTEAIELRMLGELGYDATTLGNHEFDYGSDGLADMLQTAREKAAAGKEELPELVECNVNTDSSSATGDGESLLAALDDYGMKPYIMLQKGEVSIAVLGVFGEDALACAPTCELAFEDPVESVKKTVKEIKEKENPDMIVCLSHSGTGDEIAKSEDEILAKEVPELDVIVSGHTHTKLDEPIVAGDTYIVSAQCYGRYMGDCSLTQKADGRWKMTAYQLPELNESVEQDETVLKELDGFEAKIDEQYLGQFGYKSNQVLANNTIDFESVEDLYQNHTESRLGDLMSDSYVAATKAEQAEDEFLPIGIVPSGVVRETYPKGAITVSDVFNSFSLGVGADGVVGYPLIRVYLTGKELKTACEVDASVTDYMQSARLYMSGISFSYNPNRILLNRVTNVTVTNKKGKQVAIKDDQLYPVVSDLYSANMLGAVTKMSYGILKVVPKDAQGAEVTDFNDSIIQKNGKELKAWVAIASYMESFEKDGKGVANVPAYYETFHERKVVEDDASIGAILKNPSPYVWLVLGVVAVLAVIVALIIWGIIKIVRKMKSRKI